MKEPPVTHFDLACVCLVGAMGGYCLSILLHPTLKAERRQDAALTYLSNRVEVINQMEQAVKHFNKK